MELKFVVRLGDCAADKEDHLAEIEVGRHRRGNEDQKFCFFWEG